MDCNPATTELPSPEKRHCNIIEEKSLVDYRLKLFLDCDMGISADGSTSLDEETDREVLRRFLSRIEHGNYDLSSVKFNNEARHHQENGQRERQQRREHREQQHQSVQLGGIPADVIIATIKEVGIPVFTALLGAYLQAKYRRKVRLKVNDVEIETSNIKELERMIVQVGRLTDAVNKSKDRKSEQ
jgi:hypothetical protein